MYFLDADSWNLLVRGHPLISRRVFDAAELVFVSSITIEEIVGGQLRSISAQRTRSTVGVGYVSKFFVNVVAQLADFSLVSYTDTAEEVFRLYPAAIKRIGPMDCRLAAHASTLGFTIVTRNVADFSRIPDVRYEDWSKE